MRYLYFNLETNVDQYEILYDGLSASTSPITAAETRVISRILDKFEALGEPTERGQGPTFGLARDGAVALDDIEYKLAARVYTEAPWKVRHARRIAKTMDFFDSAPTTEQVIHVAK